MGPKTKDKRHTEETERGNEKKILVADLDRTLIPAPYEEFLNKRLTDYLAGSSYNFPEEPKEKIDEIYRKRRESKSAGKDMEASSIEDEAYWTEKFFEGGEVEKVDPLIRGFVEEELRNIPDSLQKNLERMGMPFYLISGTPDPVVKYFAEGLGAEDGAGAIIKEENGRYTGEIDRIIDHKDKERRFWDVINKERDKGHRINLDESYGLGDSFADFGYLPHVGNSYIIGERSDFYDPEKNDLWKALRYHEKTKEGKIKLKMYTPEGIIEHDPEEDSSEVTKTKIETPAEVALEEIEKEVNRSKNPIKNWLRDRAGEILFF